jgi:hypothetical protein
LPEYLLLIVERVSEAIVRIETPAGDASGTIIDGLGNILTTYGVVEGYSKVVVHTKDKSTFTATVVGFDEIRDIAIIKANAEEGRQFESISLSVRQPVAGEEIFTVGFPLELRSAGALTAGRVLDIDNSGGRSLLRTDFAVPAETSGGAAVDREGNFVGVPTANIIGAVNVGFVIPGYDIAGDLVLLKNGAKILRPEGTPGPGPVATIAPTGSPNGTDDHGDGRTSATSVDLTIANTPLIIEGRLETPSDIDTFRFQSLNGETFVFNVNFLVRGSIVTAIGHPRMVLYGVTPASPLAVDDRAGTLLYVTRGGTMYLDVFSNNTQNFGGYRIVAERVR